jgi:calmodulin
MLTDSPTSSNSAPHSQQLEEIFGTSDTNSTKDLSLTEFLHSLNMSQVKQLRSKVTAKTYKPPPQATKKR